LGKTRHPAVAFPEGAAIIRHIRHPTV
jgi:hypothetical protein